MVFRLKALRVSYYFRDRERRSATEVVSVFEVEMYSSPDPWLMEEDLRACSAVPVAQRPGIDTHTDAPRGAGGLPSVIRKSQRTEKAIDYLISHFTVKRAATHLTKNRPMDF